MKSNMSPLYNEMRKVLLNARKSPQENIICDLEIKTSTGQNFMLENRFVYSHNAAWSTNAVYDKQERVSSQATIIAISAMSEIQNESRAGKGTIASVVGIFQSGTICHKISILEKYSKNRLTSRQKAVEDNVQITAIIYCDDFLVFAVQGGKIMDAIVQFSNNNDLLSSGNKVSSINTRAGEYNMSRPLSLEKGRSVYEIQENLEEQIMIMREKYGLEGFYKLKMTDHKQQDHRFEKNITTFEVFAETTYGAGAMAERLIIRYVCVVLGQDEAHAYLFRNELEDGNSMKITLNASVKTGIQEYAILKKISFAKCFVSGYVELNNSSTIAVFFEAPTMQIRQKHIDDNKNSIGSEIVDVETDTLIEYAQLTE